MSNQESPTDKQIASSAETEVGTFQYGSRIYRVIKIEGNEYIPYHLIGPKGGSYDLYRNQTNTDRFFAVNHANFTKGTPFEGKWFTDKNRDGTPCPLRMI